MGTRPAVGSLAASAAGHGGTATSALGTPTRAFPRSYNAH